MQQKNQPSRPLPVSTEDRTEYTENIEAISILTYAYHRKPATGNSYLISGVRHPVDME